MKNLPEAFCTLVMVALALGLASPQILSAAAEKGPRCSDGEDNDGDGYIDGADPDCGGDSGGSDEENKVPLTLTYGVGGGIQGDGNLTYGPQYDHGNPDTNEMRIFIGSAGNAGNIFMQFGPDHTYPDDGSHDRGLKVDLSSPVDVGVPIDAQTCQLLPQGSEGTMVDITPHFHNIDLNSFTPNGLYGLDAVGVTGPGAMRIRLFDPGINPATDPDGEAYFFDFQPVGGNSPCAGDWDLISIERTAVEGQDGAAADEWTVTIHGDSDGDGVTDGLACLEKAKGPRGIKAAFCGAYHLPSTFTITPCSSCPPAI